MVELVLPPRVPRRPRRFLRPISQRNPGLLLPAQGGQPREHASEPAAGATHVSAEHYGNRRSDQSGGEVNMHIISGALLLVRTHRRELLLQVLAYPVLALLWAAWLWIPDAHWYQLLLTALLALAIALSGLWINATTMRAYREESSSTSALRMLSVLLWFVILAALLWW